MSESRADVVAERLTARIGELGQALSGAGADPHEAQRLLELAALAAMHAVGLEELSTLRPEPARRVPQAAPAPRLSAAA